MPRQRMIAPGIWHDGRVVRLGDDLALLIWIGMCCQADDEGLVEVGPHALKAALALRAAVAEVKAALDKIFGVGLAVLYEHEGQSFALIPRWYRHQRLARPAPTKHPRPPDDLVARFPEYLEARTRTFNGPHSRHQGFFGAVEGEEGGQGTKGAPRNPRAPAPPYGEIKTAWNTMAATCGLPTIRKVTEKRRRAIRQRWAHADWRENWRRALDTIPGCAFLVSSEVGGTWIADFEWFVKPDSVMKVLEGNYADRTAGETPRPPGPPIEVM